MRLGDGGGGVVGDSGDIDVAGDVQQLAKPFDDDGMVVDQQH